MDARRLTSRLACSLVALALCGCITLTREPRALVARDGAIEVATLACPAALQRAQARTPDGAATLDPAAIRIATWNLHKQADAGWSADLAALAKGSDILLLQEARLEDPLQVLLAEAGMRWVMASSFLYADADNGVLTASRVAPLASCTQRVVEPLLRIPKSAVVDWYPIAGTPRTLAVANVHAINFTLSLDAYRAQLDALADTLAAHDGPIVLGGDLNTWTDARLDVVRGIASRLSLTEIAYAPDERSLFFGRQLDHLLVRGLAVDAARAHRVTSSDHNPVDAVVRLAY